MTTHTSTAQRSSKYPTTIGIDVGGTGMKGGLVRLGSGPKAGTLRGDRFRIPTPQPAMPEPVAATLAAITAELDGREKAPKPSAPLGVCFPSIVKDGVCLSANNIDHTWIGTDLRGTFEEHLRRPVTVVNDADAAGLAEARDSAITPSSSSEPTSKFGTSMPSWIIAPPMPVPRVITCTRPRTPRPAP